MTQTLTNLMKAFPHRLNQNYTICSVFQFHGFFKSFGTVWIFNIERKEWIFFENE